MRGADIRRKGHYLDLYDYGAFRELLLDPLSPGGSGQYNARQFDLESDKPFDLPSRAAEPTAVLLVDGIFLQRREILIRIGISRYFCRWISRLRSHAARSAARRANPPDPDAPLNQRYVGGQKTYLHECAPAQRADIVVDYNDLRGPKVLKWNASHR